MNSTKTTTELKTIARGLLMGKYGIYIRAFAFIEATIFILTFATTLFIPEGVLWGEILNFLLTLILDLLAAVFSLGLIRFTLNICREQPYEFKDIFYGFSSHPDKAIIAKFLFTLMDLACLLPAILLFILYAIAPAKSVFLLLASLLLVIGGSIYTILHLTFDFVFYTMADYPDATLKELFRYCASVMKGQRMKYFYLLASFLPLYILAFCSFGIGLLFVIPYQNVTVAQFYQDVFYIREEDKTEKEEVIENVGMA